MSFLSPWVYGVHDYTHGERNSFTMGCVLWALPSLCIMSFTDYAKKQYAEFLLDFPSPSPDVIRATEICTLDAERMISALATSGIGTGRWDVLLFPRESGFHCSAAFRLAGFSVTCVLFGVVINTDVGPDPRYHVRGVVEKWNLSFDEAHNELFLLAALGPRNAASLDGPTYLRILKSEQVMLMYRPVRESRFAVAVQPADLPQEDEPPQWAFQWV